MLVIFAGLPGVGKTTIARMLASRLGAVYLRVDTIEQAMRDDGLSDAAIGGMGYLVAQRIATENLKLGRTVVADTVNPLELTRQMWREAGSPNFEVEVVCSDPVEHRRRVESRRADIPGHAHPTWQEVLDRDYHAWTTPRLVVDTATLPPEAAVEAILGRLDSVG